MKRRIALLLCLLIVLGLFCACGNENESSTPQSKYVGTWVTDANNRELGSFRLLADGKVIWSPYSGSVVEYDIARAGEWTLDGDRIIIFFDAENESYLYNAFILNIVDDTSMMWREDVFTKID